MFVHIHLSVPAHDMYTYIHDSYKNKNRFSKDTYHLNMKRTNMFMTCKPENMSVSFIFSEFSELCAFVSLIVTEVC